MRADAAHHLVMDEQDAVSVADFADARIVAVGRHQRVGRGAADRLHDEGDDALRSLGEDLLLQHVGIVDAALFHREVVAVAIGGRRRHCRHQPHLVGERCRSASSNTSNCSCLLVQLRIARGSPAKTLIRRPSKSSRMPSSGTLEDLVLRSAVTRGATCWRRCGRRGRRIRAATCSSCSTAASPAGKSPTIAGTW